MPFITGQICSLNPCCSISGSILITSSFSVSVNPWSCRDFEALTTVILKPKMIILNVTSRCFSSCIEQCAWVLHVHAESYMWYNAVPRSNSRTMLVWALAEALGKEHVWELVFSILSSLTHTNSTIASAWVSLEVLRTRCFVMLHFFRHCWANS